MNEEKLTKEEKEVYERVNTFAVSQFKIKNAINKCLTGVVNVDKLDVLMPKAKKLIVYGLKTDKMLDDIFDKTRSTKISDEEKKELNVVQESYKEQLKEFKSFYAAAKKVYLKAQSEQSLTAF